MLHVYRQARLATMTIIGRTETVSDELPGAAWLSPELFALGMFSAPLA